MPALLLLGIVAVVVALTLWLATLRSSLRIGLLAGYVALLQFIPGTAVAPYAIPLPGGVSVTPANAIVAGLFMTAIVLVAVERDPIAVRLVLVAVLGAGLLEVALLATTEWALTSGAVIPVLDIPVGTYGTLATVLLAGTPLVAFEVSVAVLAVEWLRRRVLGHRALAVGVVGVFVGVLLLDGLLFTGLLRLLAPELHVSLAGGLAAKAVLALLYAGPLLAFLLRSRTVRGAAQDVPLRLRDVLLARHVEVVERFDEGERQRIRLMERTLQVAEEERSRLAGELHDEAIQLLTAADIRLQGVAARTADEDVERVRGLVADGVESLRRLTLQLRAPEVTGRSFAGLVASYVDRLAVDAAVELDTHVPHEVPPAVASGAYRIVLEAVSNAARHAGADRIIVRVQVEDGVLVGVVADDGVGIAPDAATGPGHLGLRAMRERTDALGGHVSVAAVPPGTVVSFGLPLEE